VAPVGVVGSAVDPGKVGILDLSLRSPSPAATPTESAPIFAAFTPRSIATRRFQCLTKARGMG
jgi:hypothetical protein